MLLKPALNYFYLFFDRSYSEKTVFFSVDYKSKGTDGAPFSPLELLGASKQVNKSKRNGADLAKCNRKVFSSHWGLHDKKHGKVCPQLPPIFPASTVLNAGIAGDTVEAILYRVEVIIYLQILLLLFLPQLQKFYFYYDESVQLEISIYFQFYHSLITLKHTLLLLILLFIFRFKNFFQNFFFPRAVIHPI